MDIGFEYSLPYISIPKYISPRSVMQVRTLVLSLTIYIKLEKLLVLTPGELKYLENIVIWHLNQNIFKNVMKDKNVVMQKQSGNHQSGVR